MGGSLFKSGSGVMCGDHLKSPEDIGEGLPQFPSGTTSLLSKYLSQKIWNKYKDVKDAHGFSFKQAIFSGARNLNSGIGVYAGSHDSYYTFSDMFDQIIEDYHGHKKTDKHIMDMDYRNLNCPPFPRDEAAMILSTRVRVARNLADFPLGAGCSEQQYKDIEKYVVKATSKFKGDLAGKYYSLETMSAKDQNALIADHFLFKEGDKYLEAAGLNRFWPKGRGIFHNHNKTFLIWVNEEDQLRIISMEKGADIGNVFKRLSTAAQLIENEAEFAKDDHLGYITSCPTNLGTGLRASVHIKLPKLGKDMTTFEKIASDYFVQIRGIHGEHSDDDSGIYDISNKRRLGRNEVQLVQDMYDGVKAMIEKEKELTRK